MGFRHIPNIFNEIDKLRKLNTYVDCKLVLSDGSQIVGGSVWWTGCRDDDIHSINYGLKLINEIYDDSENDSMLYDIERTELVVRSTEISPPCLMPPLSRSSSTVRITRSEINDEE